MDEHVYPNEQRVQEEVEQNRWMPTKIVEELKAIARAEGLWNLFLPDDENGAGLTHAMYRLGPVRSGRQACSRWATSGLSADRAPHRPTSLRWGSVPRR
jgi:alkylation response protein AidB-like acyl-CoA dehydrogenase